MKTKLKFLLINFFLVLLGLTFFPLSLLGQAADPVQRIMLQNPQDQNINSLRSSAKAEISAENKALNFIKANQAAIGTNAIENKLQLLSKKTDKNGLTHVRYNQVINSVPVFGTQLLAHFNQNNQLTALSGVWLKEENLDTTPSISKDKALEISTELFTANYQRTAILQNSQLTFFNLSSIGPTKDKESKLIWLILLSDALNKNTHYYFIDAHHGTLVLDYPGVKNALSRKIYDCSVNPYGDLDYFDSRYNYTFGRSEGQAARGPNPFNGKTDTDKLYDTLTWVYNYYLNVHSMMGANGQGGTGEGTHTPYGETPAYSFYDYDSPYPNAFFDPYDGAIGFSMGMVTYDIVGHEYGHAVSERNVLNTQGQPAGLVYAYEPGALSESFADIMGEALENYVYTTLNLGQSDWQMGEDSVLDSIRSMSQPDSDKVAYNDRQADNYYHRLVVCTSADYGGVHANSGILNFATYLMAMGGSKTGCLVQAVGKEMQEKVIFHAFTQHLTPTASFLDAFNAILLSCSELYPDKTYQCKQIEKAMLGVYFNQPGICEGPGVPPAPTCAAIDAAYQPTPEPTATPIPATPTPVPTATPVYNYQNVKFTAKITDSTGKLSASQGGKAVNILLTRTKNSGAPQDQATLQLKVGKVMCPQFRPYDIATTKKIKSAFPKLKKASGISLVVSNLLGTITAQSSFKLLATGGVKSQPTNTKICSTFFLKLP